MVSATTQQEVQALLDVGFSKPEDGSFLHLRSKLSVFSYIRIADEVNKFLAPKKPARILDWGTGYGQMTYLLQRRGLEVVSYVHQEERLPAGAEGEVGEIEFGQTILPVVFGSEQVKLPFEDGAFDAVLSSGVLEHVSDENGSLDEIRRILKPKGYLFVYQLPQKGSWMEFIIKRFSLGYWHDRKYSGRGARQLLEEHGFKVEDWRRANMLPKNFSGLPRRLKAAFEKQPELVLKADNLLSRIPVLNYVGGVLELIAYKA